MGTLLQDVRYGLRMLVKKPGFTLVAVLTLAVGVGANTAIFSVVNAVLLRSLPLRDPDRLVKITFSNPGIGLATTPYSIPELEDLVTRAGVFEDVSGMLTASANLTGAKQPERLEFIGVTPNYFTILGTSAQIGRLIEPQDSALGFSTAVVISDALWRRAFGADPNVLGKPVRLDNDFYTIVGVAQPWFRHPGPSQSGRDIELWGTCGFRAAPFPQPIRSARYLPMAIGRLKPGISLAQAQARLRDMAVQIRQDDPANYPPQAKWTILAEGLQESLVGSVRPMLIVLLAAVGVIVCVVSLNIGGLLLARASGRQQEMAVRTAMGASSGRIVRQMLTESMLLAAIGGAAGIVAAVALMGPLKAVIPDSIPRINDIGVDWRVLTFALGISVVAGALFGLAPAFQSARSGIASQIREGTRGTGSGARTTRVRDALILSEMALAIVLMVGAGLLVRTLRTLLAEDPGFNPSRVVTADVWLPVPNDPTQDPYLSARAQAVFHRELLRRLNAIPGVELAGVTSSLPTTGGGGNTIITVEDKPVESSADLRAEILLASPDYFRVIGAGVIRGRLFTDQDDTTQDRVGIIDQATAKRFWGADDPLGKRFHFGRNPQAPWITVVGLVKDIKNDALEVSGVPHVWVPVLQARGRQYSVALRTTRDPPHLEAPIREAIQSIDPGLPIYNVRAMQEVVGASLAPRRFSANLVVGFAGLALLLASIGIYGLLAYIVGQRAREIGLRMALGAQPGDVLALILKRGLTLAGAGVLAGVVLAVIAAWLMKGLLYGVSPFDPAAFVVAPVLLLLVSVAASYVPALRAARVDPMVALREG
jgi:putative ABC transport system permease protein